MTIFSRSKLYYILIALFLGTTVLASGGYDNGTPAGKGNLDLDFTINPGNVFENGQSYVVWGYGLTDRLDFHGYVSQDAMGTYQIYYGVMYNFFSNRHLDLSTAFGLRHLRGNTDIIFPQLLYTIKLSQGYDIIGSSVLVYRVDQEKGLGVTFDIAFRIPVPEKFTPSFARDIKFAIGAFRGVSRRWLPTYSIDFRF